MDVKSYIDSGMLEAYVAGYLPAAQEEEVLDMARKYPAIRAELDRVEEAMEHMAKSAAIVPASRVEGELMSKIGKGREDSSPPKEGEGLSQWWPYITGLLLLALAGLGYHHHTSQQDCLDLEQELINIRNERTIYAAQVDSVQTELYAIQSSMSILTNSDFARVVMSGTANAPESKATAYWNKATSELYLSIGRLQALSQEQQYQLWAIVDGVPVDAGVFDLDTAYINQMKMISGEVSTFAITIERRGGSPTPSLESMQVAGNL